MDKLRNLVRKAATSKFYLSLLNRLLWGIIPFNKPHRFRILKINADGVEILVPYRKTNLNHLKGIHACALATASEYAAGLTLLLGLGTDEYRLIMKKLEMEYHYQGKMDCIALFSMPEEILTREVKQPLATQEAVFVVCLVEVKDVSGNLISTGKTEWQVKRWDKVKTTL